MTLARTFGLEGRLVPNNLARSWKPVEDQTVRELFDWYIRSTQSKMIR